MPPPASHGVFVSSKVVDSHDKEALRKLCFKTTSAYEFPLRHLDDEDRAATNPESSELTYAMGVKPSKYMGIMAREAKNWDRDQCMYTTQFPQHALGDSFVNKMLAERNNPQFKGKGAAVPSKMGSSTYTGDFRSGSPEQRRKANLGPQRPMTSAPIATGSMLETRSFAHNAHGAPSAEAGRLARSGLQVPQDNLESSGASQPEHLFRSTYGHSFSSLKTSTSEGRLRTRYPSMTRSRTRG